MPFKVMRRTMGAPSEFTLDLLRMNSSLKVFLVDIRLPNLCLERVPVTPDELCALTSKTNLEWTLEFALRKTLHP